MTFHVEHLARKADSAQETSAAPATCMAESFAREAMVMVLDEIQPLLLAHWQELAFYPDIPLKPDWQRYQQAEAQDVLRIYTVRKGLRLIGYAIYGLGTSLHYSDCLQATQDVLYVHPQYRHGAVGWKLIRFADEQLKAEGVHLVVQHTKARHSIGPLLDRMGYELMDLLYVKRF